MSTYLHAKMQQTNAKCTLYINMYLIVSSSIQCSSQNETLQIRRIGTYAKMYEIARNTHYSTYLNWTKKLNIDLFD